MPYSYHKDDKGYTVTKKDTGAVVGHTTASKLKAYLAALHIHAMSKGGVVHKCSKDCHGYGLSC